MEEYIKCVEDNDYSVSNFGNVRNDMKNKILKQSDNNGYKIVSLNGKFNRVHRLIANAFIDNPTNKPCIDHINNDKSDNRIENLRWVTIKENNFNRSISKKNTSGSKGVYWHKASKKWMAYIRIDNILITLGYFKDKNDAIEVRRKKAIEEFGEFINQCEICKQPINI
jgi:hypothetical protein